MTAPKPDASPKSSVESLVDKLRIAEQALARIQSDAEYCFGKPFDWTARLGSIAKEAIVVIGTIAPVSAETVLPITPAKLHFSDCSIYDKSGTEIPDAECDCGGAVEDKTGTPLVILGDASTRKDEGASTGVTPPDMRTANSPARCEISVDAKKLESALADYLEGYEDLSSGRCRARAQQIVYSVILPFLNAETEPVSVEVCIAALWNAYHNQMHGLGDYWANKQGRPEVFKEALAYGEYEKDAKTVLDAAGVKYHED